MKRPVFGAALFAAIFGLTASFAGDAHSFSWPAKEWDKAKSIFTFSQNRKDRFCQSLVLRGVQTASATDKGKIIAVITEKQSDGDWFESPLGNALIISHDDSLISVYGNLTPQSAAALSQKTCLEDEEALGQTGMSSWSESEEGGELEFQIADAGSKTFINPIILMPRNLKPPKIELDGISIENQFGRAYNLAALRSAPAGVYKIYKKRQADVNVYKSELYVNGAEIEKISKKTLKCQDGRLALAGKELYTSQEFYPAGDREFLGHILLPHGSDTVTLVASDIFDSASTLNFTVSGY